MIICSPRGARAAGSFCFGDIDSNGNEVVQYWYDAWGNHKVVNSSGMEITDPDHIGNLNPFRYRGYYFDRETGLYFLQTRYYDPEIGRFLNRDSVFFANPEKINGLNLYSYCLNNPIAYTDSTGFAEWYDWLLAGIVIVGSAIAAPFTAGTSLVAAGAFAAVAIGGTISIVSQVAETGDFSMDKLAADMVSSAISGGLAATGLGLPEQIFGNIAIGAGSALLQSGLSGEPITLESGVGSILSGLIGGWAGGKGAIYIPSNSLMQSFSVRSLANNELCEALFRSNLFVQSYNFIRYIIKGVI